jgi:hypothetical protein
VMRPLVNLPPSRLTKGFLLSPRRPPSGQVKFQKHPP